MILAWFPLSLLLAFSGCGGNGGGGRSAGGEGYGGLDGDGKAWIIGTWSGSYQNLNASPDSELRETAAWIDFTTTGERAGKFHLKLLQMNGVEVKGTFSDVNNQNLIFKVTDSNLSSMGMPGATKTFEYELAKDALTLDNVRVKFILTRESSPTDKSKDASPGGGENSSDQLTGTWQGQDVRGRMWRLKLFAATRFTIEVSEPGKAGLWMTGVPRLVEDTKELDAVLKVEESAIRDYVGLEYRVRIIDGISLELRRLGERLPDGSQADLETFVCTKAD